MDYLLFLTLIIYVLFYNDNKHFKRLLLIYLILILINNIYNCFIPYKTIEGADNLDEVINYDKKIYDMINENILILKDVNYLKTMINQIDDKINTKLDINKSNKIKDKIITPENISNLSGSTINLQNLLTSINQFYFKKDLLISKSGDKIIKISPGICSSSDLSKIISLDKEITIDLNNKDNLGKDLKLTDNQFISIFICITNNNEIKGYFDTSNIFANKPDNVICYRRIGTIRTDDKKNIISFIQLSNCPNKFFYTNELIEINNNFDGLRNYPVKFAPPNTEGFFRIRAITKIDWKHCWLHLTPKDNFYTRLLSVESNRINDNSISNNGYVIVSNDGFIGINGGGNGGVKILECYCNGWYDNFLF